MNFLDRVKIAMAAFRGTAGVGLPKQGRSSEESLGSSLASYNAMFGSVNPVIDFEMLAALKNLWLYNPDVSQYVANIVNLGNPGHQIVVEAGTDAKAEAALNRINETASRIYDHGCGVDGLINQYLTSLAWSGAVSSEDVVNLSARRIEKVALVPVDQIRFKYNKDLDTYEPYQRSTSLRGLRGDLGLIPLNTETFKYFALSTVENSPYAKPPATAAVDAILKGQVPIMENIQFMAKKVGLLGLIALSVVPPPRNRGNESDPEYRIRAAQYIKDVKTAVEGNLSEGLLVTARDQKVEHTPVTTGAAGVYDINRISEEQVFSGLGAMPGFHGRTDSTTETFADVVYYLLTAQVTNIQRVVKRRQERTYRLDLMLGGLDVDGINMQFNKAHSRNAKAEAETEEIHLRTVMSKVKAGLITPDQGAQELGYDDWADTGMITADNGMPSRSLGRQPREKDSTVLNLQFDRSTQTYRYQPETIEIWSGASQIETAANVVPIKKKTRQRV